jgi:hypothetical protein
MIRICKRPAAADGDETGIADFGKDHGCTVLSASAQLFVLLRFAAESYQTVQRKAIC